mmetsp:Transcript_97009/g.224869  ORF Transcript_97009/g.224869 Transcript_97009/m.224869 type:complete len:446 (-) Transcript_97009:93-1430(-)
MARAAAISASLAAPCAAFVQGNLRASSVAAPGQVQVLVESPLPAEAPAQGRALGLSTAAAGGLALVGLAVGATRASVRKQQPPAQVACRAVGVCPPLTEKWDPLDLGSTDEKMERYTAAEVKHGRVAMIACVGYVIPEVFRFPGTESFENGLGALSSLPVEGWVQIFAFIGAHDLLIKPRAGGLGPYDFGFGTELIEGIPAEELERRQTSERNNGRLAMVGIMGLLVQDSMFDKNPIALLKSDGWWGPSVDVFIKDIPICMGTSLCATEAAAEPRMSASVPFLKYPEVLDGWAGGEKGFDPLGCTDACPVYFFREAELKHGRVCMLATVGWMATDLGVRFPGEIFQNVTTLEAHNKMVEAGIMGPFLATIGVYELYSGWLCIEGYEGKIKRDAGDFFLGKNFLPKDEAKEAEMRLKELENGRLAMFAFSGICTQAALTGQTWPFL